MDSTNNYLYISYSHEENLEEVRNLLTSLKIPHKYHTSKDIYGSSGVVFILSEDYDWKYEIDDLSVCTQKDLCVALSKNIPIYIAYKKRSDDMLGIYKAELIYEDNILISGIRSTGTFRDYHNKFQFAPKPKESPWDFTTNNINNRKKFLILL